MKAGARHFYISNLPPSRAQTVLATIVEKARSNQAPVGSGLPGLSVSEGSRIGPPEGGPHA